MEDREIRKERLEAILYNVQKSDMKGRVTSVQISVLKDELAKIDGGPTTWRKDI